MEDSSPCSETLVPIVVVVIAVLVVVVRFLEEGGGDGGVGVGAGAGAGTTGSGSGCTGRSGIIEGGSGGSNFEEFAAAAAAAADISATRRLSQTAANVVCKQAFTALLVVAVASLLPILDNSEVILALLVLVLLGQKTTPYSALKGTRTISSLK